MPALGYRSRFMRHAQDRSLGKGKRRRFPDGSDRSLDKSPGGRPEASARSLAVLRRRAPAGGAPPSRAGPRVEPDDGADPGVDSGVDQEAPAPVRPSLRREAQHLAAPEDQPTRAELRNGQYFLSLHGTMGRKLLERAHWKGGAREDAEPTENDETYELLEDEDADNTKTTDRQVEAICRARDNYQDWVVNRHIPRRLRRYKQMGKDDEDDNEQNDMNEEEKHSVDREWMMKEYAKVQICNADTNADILMKAELLIEEDWLDKIDALPGNLFCLGAFGDIYPRNVPLCSVQRLKAVSKLLGCLLIIIIQVIGPPLIFLSKMPGNIGVMDKLRYEWRCFPLSFNPLYDPLDKTPCPGGELPGQISLTSDWNHIMTTRVLSLAFMFAFILNGIFVLLEEKKTWKNVWNTFRFLDWKNENFKLSGKTFLIMGAVVNCHVIIWTCLDMYVVAGASMSPQDLIMDALGLLFLYNLDDIGGDLGFVDEDDWPALRVAWIYNELVHPWPDEEFDEDAMDWWGWICLNNYRFITVLLVVLLVVIPVLSCVTPFAQIVPDD